ncbi:histidine kinase [Soonwooa sp.]|uniref:sensor histidine kinase n=1 Tax=Soonwooa sp. TaxID=1938592 RepID=UPI002634AA95|nr:histidine kinase [Soonwooa sp.]
MLARLFFFLIPIFYLSQSTYRTELIQYTDGLTSDKVFGTLKKDNFLYIYTQKGISVYDGYVFVSHKDISSTVYFATNDDQSIYLEESGKGLLKVENIHSKLNVLLPVNFRDGNPNNDHFENLYLAADNKIWCTDFNHVKYFDFKTKRQKNFLIDKKNKDLKFNFQFVPSENGLLMFSRFGVFEWNKNTDRIRLVRRQSFNSAIRLGKDVFVISPDAWLGKLNADVGVPIQMLLTTSAKFVAQPISNSSLAFYDEHQLSIFDFKTNKIETVVQSLESINHVFYDSETGIFWISTNNGLLKVSKEQNKIKNIVLNKPAPKSISDILEDGLGQMWFADKQQLLYRQNKEQNIEAFPIAGIPNRLSLDRDFLYVATDIGIFRKSVADNDAFEKIIACDNYKAKLAKVWDSKIWVLPDSGPIRVYDLITFKELNNFLTNKESFFSINLFNDLITKDDKMWLASWMPQDFGISYFDKSAKAFKQITRIKGNHDLFVADYYNRGAFLENGDVIFSSYGGWNIVNPEKLIVKSMNTREFKIDNDNIQGIVQDSKKNIWFGTGEGIYQFNLKTDKTTRLSKIDGLASNDVTQAFYLTRDQWLYFSTDYHVQKIDIKNILRTELINVLKLTSVKANNVNLDYGENEILKFKEKDINQLDFNFSALNFADKDKLIYRYRINNEEWTYLGNEPKISLAMPVAGDYLVEVQVGDNLGNIQPRTLKFKFEISAPFYKTWWFWLLSLLLVAFLTFRFTYFLVQQEKQKGILKKRAKENENKMLRSQMNPHFLFNSLNSINSFIIQNKDKEASRYLTSFSKLMRKILDNSQKETICLKEELETTKLYLDLEAVRMEYKFDYTIRISDDIEPEEVSIPPLILQPFLENAIWHGINHKNGKGHLEIRFSRDVDNFDMIVIEIEDDGVGRKKAAEIRKASAHKSYGLEITKGRILGLDKRNQVEILDLYDDNSVGIGTRVLIKIINSHD